MQPPSLILASASPRREQLLRQMGLEFTVVRPVGVEELTSGWPPEMLAMRNARRKARAVAQLHPTALVLGADTIVVLDGVVFGKPRDMAEARRMLAQLAGRAHEVFSGVCVVRLASGFEKSFYERSRVWMKPLSAEQIEAYFRVVNPMDKAGAYAAQEHGEAIIERVEGSFSNVMGLPVERLRAELTGVILP
ncbi:MAG: Maf family protein [Verrucomicrobiae bacterium]|nr:Maf family protein [Verrucomicrobiae bacterium]